MRNINIALTRGMCKDPDQFPRYDEIKRGNVNGMDANFLHNSLTVKKKKINVAEVSVNTPKTRSISPHILYSKKAENKPP